MVPKLGSWLHKNKGEASQAKDLLHEALSALIIAGHKRKKDPPSNLEAYIFTTCKYKWYEILKKNKSTVEVINEEQLTDISEGSVQDNYIQMETEALRHKMLTETFSLLSDLCQKLLNLVKEGYKAKEIAEKLDMNGQSTVNRRKFACMESWKTFLKEHSRYEELKNA